MQFYLQLNNRMETKISHWQSELSKSHELYLRIKARPGAAATKLNGTLDTSDGETIKMDVAAPPEKGKANAVIVKYLSIMFSVNKDNVKIISGAGDKLKLIKISS